MGCLLSSSGFSILPPRDPIPHPARPEIGKNMHIQTVPVHTAGLFSQLTRPVRGKTSCLSSSSPELAQICPPCLARYSLYGKRLLSKNLLQNSLLFPHPAWPDAERKIISGQPLPTSRHYFQTLSVWIRAKLHVKAGPPHSLPLFLDPAWPDI